jgi:hypothetical protein
MEREQQSNDREEQQIGEGCHPNDIQPERDHPVRTYLSVLRISASPNPAASPNQAAITSSLAIGNEFFATAPCARDRQAVPNTRRAKTQRRKERPQRRSISHVDMRYQDM